MATKIYKNRGVYNNDNSYQHKRQLVSIRGILINPTTCAQIVHKAIVRGTSRDKNFLGRSRNIWRLMLLCRIADKRLIHSRSNVIWRLLSYPFILLPAVSMKSRQSFSKSFGICWFFELFRCPSDYFYSTKPAAIFSEKSWVLLPYSLNSSTSLPLASWAKHCARIILAQEWLWRRTIVNDHRKNHVLAKTRQRIDRDIHGISSQNR